jgi:CBS domain-containing protein
VSITLFILGGVAQITREAPRPGIELKIAAAGPACSLVIGGLFGLLWFLTRGVAEPVAEMAFWLAYVNAALAVFNLIPGFPLDGGRIFRSLIWYFTGRYRRSTRIAVRVGQGFGYLCIAGGILVVAIWREWISGLWLVFLGWFLENAASSSYRQVRWHDALHGLNVSQVMISIQISVPPGTTIRDLVQNYIFTTGHQQFMVVDGGRVEGLVTLEGVKAVPQPAWETTPVRSVMTPVDQLKAAHPEQEALDALEQMEADGINQMPVVSGGRVIGVVTRDSLVRLMRTRSELGMQPTKS